MSAKPWYQDKEQLEAEVAKYGTPTRVAEVNGVNPRTVQYWARKFGIRAIVRSIPPEGGGVSREEVLASELKELRGALTQARTAAVRDERVIQTLERLVPSLEPIYAPPRAATRDSSHTAHAFLLQWSDLHAAERVFADQMNGANEYDWEIMLRRHDKIVTAIQSFKDNRPYPVSTLHIAALGDMVTGDIHDELRVTNEQTVMETALQLGMDGAKFIESFVPHFKEIIVDGIVGNHGRLTKKPQAKNQHDNFDWMVYHLLKILLKSYPNVTVNVPKSFITPIVVLDRWTCAAFHGDGIPSNMPGVPWGGVIRRTRELERQFEPLWGPIHHFLLGHFHQANIVDGRRISVNGSVKGPDEYSIKRYGAGAAAEQTLLTFHPRRGLTDVSFLDLQ